MKDRDGYFLSEFEGMQLQRWIEHAKQQLEDNATLIAEQKSYIVFLTLLLAVVHD